MGAGGEWAWGEVFIIFLIFLVHKNATYDVGVNMDREIIMSKIILLLHLACQGFV